MYVIRLSKREIVGSLSSVYFCGGDCVEDVTSHLMPHLSLHPTLRTCSSDTILRAISELTTANTTYTSDTGKSYDFNTASKLNILLVKALMSTSQLVAGESYDLDFDHQFIETEKHDAKMTYKKFTGYSSGVAVIGDLIVGIENRDGNANVRFHQQDTPNPRMDMFSFSVMLFNGRTSKKYSDSKGWHNQFYRFYTSKVDESLFKVLFPEGK